MSHYYLVKERGTFYRVYKGKNEKIKITLKNVSSEKGAEPNNNKYVMYVKLHEANNNEEYNTEAELRGYDNYFKNVLSHDNIKVPEELAKEIPILEYSTGVRYNNTVKIVIPKNKFAEKINELSKKNFDIEIELTNFWCFGKYYGITWTAEDITFI